MPTRDNFSTQKVLRALVSTDIGSNTTTNGDILDTADYDMGVFFAFDITAYTDGSFAISYEEGDESNLSDATAVPVEKVIGDAVILTAVTTATGDHTGNGVFSTKQFVRAVVTTTGVTTGATIQAVSVLKGEYNPQ